MIFNKIRVNKLFKKIEPEVDKELIALKLLKIDKNGKKDYVFGSINVKWDIQKTILKERYNIYWKIPQDKNPNIHYD